MARSVMCLFPVVFFVVIWDTTGTGRGTLIGQSETHAPAHTSVDPRVHIAAPAPGQREPVLSPIVIPPAPTSIPTPPLAQGRSTLAPMVIPPAPTSIPTVPPSSEPITPASASPKAPRPTLAPRSRVAIVTPLGVSPPPSFVGDPSVVATALVPSLPLYEQPGAPTPSGSLVNPYSVGAPLVLLVTGSQEGWVKIYVPLRPNGSTAWVPSADLSLSFIQDHIVVNLSTRQLTLYSNNLPLFQTPVAPGAPTSPTPTGLFFVTFVVKLSDPGAVYGPYALGLSAFSDIYSSFDGGPGQIAIHGTNEPGVVGTYASHGCVRLSNLAVAILAELVPQGTPVEIGN
jgi:L,D-transpeptidase catalytic domain